MAGDKKKWIVGQSKLRGYNNHANNQFPYPILTHESMIMQGHPGPS
jgi:hypothetical protein